MLQSLKKELYTKRHTYYFTNKTEENVIFADFTKIRKQVIFYMLTTAILEITETTYMRGTFSMLLSIRVGLINSNNKLGVN